MSKFGTKFKEFFKSKRGKTIGVMFITFVTELILRSVNGGRASEIVSGISDIATFVVGS